MSWLHIVLLAVAYFVGITAIGVALGKRMKQCREAGERLAAMQRRSLGL